MMAAKTSLSSAMARRIYIVIALSCCLIYLRGLFGEFLFDDFGNIIANPSLQALDGTALRWWELVTSSGSGLLHRPISMLSFGIDYSLYGFRPLGFKSTNLTIHLINGWLIYKLGRCLAPRLLPASYRCGDSHWQSEALALFTAALWLIHPLNVSSVLYVVQRMNELAALFTLAGLLCYAKGRAQMLENGTSMALPLAGLCVFATLALLSKENGALIFAYAFVIELICFQFEAVAPRQTKMVKALFWLTIAVPVALFTLYLSVRPEWLLNGYANRDFTLEQRLLTEPRVLCNYLLWILLPSPTWLGFFHDDLSTSTGLFLPATTILAIAVLIAATALAWQQRRQRPGLLFAIAWFLAGHAMESSILPLELVFEHRNYLPMFGLLLGIDCTITPWLQSHTALRRTVPVAIVILLALGGLTAIRAGDWSSQLRLALSEVKHHPDSARAQYEAGRAIIFDGAAAGNKRAAEAKAVPYFERGARLDPTDIFSTSGLILIHGTRGDLSEGLTEDLANRLRKLKWAQINPFLTVQTAAIEQRIPISTAQMKLLAEAALSNTHFSSALQAIVMDNYGHYLFSVAHDAQAAVSATIAAAALDPLNPRYQINLSKIALALGDEERARQYLRGAEDLNKSGTFDAAILELKQRIASQ